MHRCLLVFVAVSMMTLMTNAQDKSESTDTKGVAQKDPIGYFLGFSMGQQMGGQGLRADDFDASVFVAGVIDALSDNKIQLSNDELKSVQTKLQDMITGRQKEMQAKAIEQGKANKEKGVQWLKDNLKKEGIKELTGGMQYKVIAVGDGKSPNPSDRVKVHYTGRLTNGEVFDSSVERGEPAQFGVNQVIKGWQMALQKMRVGDKWMLYIPSELAYGERGSQGAIGPNEVLVFEVELLEIL